MNGGSAAAGASPWTRAAEPCPSRKRDVLVAPSHLQLPEPARAAVLGPAETIRLAHSPSYIAERFRGDCVEGLSLGRVLSAPTLW